MPWQAATLGRPVGLRPPSAHSITSRRSSTDTLTPTRTLPYYHTWWAGLGDSTTEPIQQTIALRQVQKLFFGGSRTSENRKAKLAGEAATG